MDFWSEGRMRAVEEWQYERTWGGARFVGGVEGNCHYC